MYKTFINRSNLSFTGFSLVFNINYNKNKNNVLKLKYGGFKENE